MKILRIKNKYLYLSLILLFISIFLFFILDDPNIIRVVLFGWYAEPEFTSAQQYFNAIYQYDSFVMTGSKPLQLILPILAIIPVIHYKEEVEHYFAHLFVREKKYNKEIIISLLENALFIAVSFYVVYLLVLLIGYLVFPVANSEVSWFRNVFEDVLNPTFIANHVLIYYSLIGIVNIFLPVFFYSLFAMTILLYSSKKNIFLFIPVIYHFIMMFAIPIISTLIKNVKLQDNLVYFAPQVLLAPGGLSHPSTIMLFIGFAPYLIICVILILVRLRGKERVGTNE